MTGPGGASTQSHNDQQEHRSRGASAEVDLAAVEHNVAVLIERIGVPVMAVVKADAYGHGLVPCARAAIAGGASWLGTALLEEAIELRQAGVNLPVLGWLAGPEAPWDAAVAAGVEVSVGARWALQRVRAAVVVAGLSARLHVKVDTGLGRGGCLFDELPELLADVSAAVADGSVELVGLWSHLACSDEPEHPANADQAAQFAAAVELTERAGLRPQVRHLANSAAALALPGTRWDMVRCGLPMYGLSPLPQRATPADLGLRPAMTLRAQLALVKDVRAGHAVSYGQHWHAERDTRLGLVPLGYADGIPRSASGSGPVRVGDSMTKVAGTVCMDQVVVDLGPGSPAVAGDEVVLFGSGPADPSAQDWAVAAGTISYEIVTRIGPRVPRVYRGGRADALEAGRRG